MERKVTRIVEIQKRIAKCREYLRESRDRENLKEGEQAIVMSAKKLLKKEGFIVKRMREEIDFEDECDEYENEDDNECDD
jgi:tRNA threonylcarbamoyladenosine modification (KEOPS) complex Cgi121 subunit